MFYLYRGISAEQQYEYLVLDKFKNSVLKKYQELTEVAGENAANKNFISKERLQRGVFNKSLVTLIAQSHKK